MTATIDDYMIDPAITGVPFCCISVLTRKRRGKMTVLIMKTVPKCGMDTGKIRYKFPGGMQDFCDSANPLRVLARELFEETGYYLRPNHRVDPPVLQRERTPDGHFRYYYHLWKNDVRGVLRTEVKEDDLSTLYVPTWEEIGFIEKNLYSSQRGVLHRLRLIMT